MLGPVELVADGRPVAVAAAKQRGLLALLLLHPNRTVEQDWLIDQLWEGDPPAAAKATLQAYVYRLRKLFDGPESAVALHGRPGGYLLDVPAGTLDADRFEHLLAEGRQARDAGRFEDAVVAFRAGLGLWRGAAFADIDLHAVREQARGLDERRLDATEQCLSAELGAGRHDTAVVELESLVEAHPLRERLWELLLLALYRCGRQAEALAAYQRLYRVLGDELGIQPAPPVQELQQRILEGDPTLGALSAAGGRPDEARIPRQLPATTGDFTGRADDLAELDHLLLDSGTDGPGAVVITAIAGTAGVGKTTLAVHWAHRIADRFEDGQLYVNLRGFDRGQPMQTAEAMRGFLDALHVAPERIPTDPDARTGLYRTLLADKRMLVVLDNARDVDQVRPLLPGGRGNLVVVTSRNQLTGLITLAGAHPLTLDVLTRTEARHYLERRLGRDRVAAEPDAVDGIIDSCARLPLALAIVATRAAMHRRFSFQALAEELRDSHRGLDTFADQDRNTDVRAVFSWSYTQLAPEAARLFRLLGLHPGPDISTAAAASLAGVPPLQARPLLAELTRAHLIIEHRPGRYTSHDLLRAYAAELARDTDSADERHLAAHRMLDHYLRTAHTANRLLRPTREPIELVPSLDDCHPEPLTDSDQAMAWFTAEHAVLLAVVDYSASAEFDAHTWQLAWCCADFFNLRGHWHDQIATDRAAVAAAHRLTDLDAEARAHRFLAHGLMRAGRFDDAQTHLRHALRLHRQSGDLAGEAHAHHTFATMLAGQARHTDALDHATQALDLYQRADHPIGLSTAFNAVGFLHALLGDHTEALDYCRQSLDRTRSDDHSGLAATWDSLGYIHHHLGDHAQAVDSYEHALDNYRIVGNRLEEAATLIRLGDTHHATGNPDPARNAWQAALDILAALDHPDADTVRTKLDAHDTVAQ
ncbi:AfsR/SARP family transcriptional regulator [Glycomyces paridis]|uniref:AfsR/SARP family transcriptional regulator n=1 Tax=Glycomyces paridis TaxID=2126555 RepID=UPI001957BDA4|nr:AfsR/SARP family transcriptional regulator [Glycomyces paridis]